jgi:sulfite reductase (NADPH) flavoprotein alpha-component
MFHSPRPLTVLFATETGTAVVRAEWAVTRAATLGLAARAIDMATYNTYRLGDERDLVIITSTHGEGEPPSTAADFFDFLDDLDAGKLDHITYAVLALGDSGYDQFCAAGRRIDERLETLGARRIVARRDSDVGEQREDREWLADVLALFATTVPGDGV